LERSLRGLLLVMVVVTTWPWSVRAAEPAAQDPPDARALPEAVVPAPAASEPPPARWDYAFIPVLFYGPETSLGVAVGGAVFGDSPAPPGVPRRDDSLTVLFQGTLRKQFSVGLSGVKFWDTARYQLTEDANWIRFPSYFWGIGNDTPDTAKELYAQSLVTNRASFAVRIFEEIYLGAGAGVGWYATSGGSPDGSVATYLAATGARGGVIGAGPVLRRDTRDDAIGSHRGSLTAVTATFYGSAFGGTYRYQVYDLDQRTFVPLGDRTVLALQGYAVYAPGNVPLAELPALGGPARLRGYYQGRFRDHLYVVGQLELRVRVAWRFSVAPFAAVGNVFSDPAAASLSHPKLAGGAALRFNLKKERDLNIHLDVARSPISSGVYLNLGEAF
jgi:hypothetical protein